MELFETESKVYNDYLRRKIAGETLDINDVTPEDLEDMWYKTCDGAVANLFDVKKSKVYYIRHKYGITLRNVIYKKCVSEWLNKEIK